MIISCGIDNLLDSLFRQLSVFFGTVNRETIKLVIPITLDRMEVILSNNSKDNKRVWVNGEVIFTPNNSVQYSIFLYLLSNVLYMNNMSGDNIYYLNKIMNSVDWFYTTELPSRFYVEHPVGSVMGKAKYGENFFFYQGCTVGVSYSINGEIITPIIGDNVLMLANSSILGDSIIGNNVIVAANTLIVNDEVPSNSLVFGQSPNLIIKMRGEVEMIRRLFSITQLNYK